MANYESLLFNRTKWKIFVALFIGYSFYYYVRKTFTFCIPSFVDELGLDKHNQYKLGIITSCFTITYGLSKFVAGFLTDRLSSRAVFTIGLLLSGLLNIVIGFYHSLWSLMLLWGINGLVQGLGWPPCARLLREWFSSNELGTVWSVLTASSNLAASISPIITSYLLLNYDINSAFIFPGIITVMICVPIYMTIYNTPSEIGLIDNVDSVSRQQDNQQASSSDVTGVFRYPFFWLISMGYFTVAFVKFGIGDWCQLYLIQEKGKSLYDAGFAMSMFEVGGFMGCASSGYLSDLLVAKNPRSTSSPRIPLVLLYLLSLAISLYCLHNLVTIATSRAMLVVVMVSIGCCSVGPINIFGVLAVENSPKELTSTTHGFVALAASIGAICSGYPLSILTRYYDWAGMMVALQSVSLASLLLIFLARNLSCSMDNNYNKDL